MNSTVILSIVVPCYNEEKNLHNLFEKFNDSFAGESNTEVIFVNNGSTDQSSRVFNNLLLKFSQLNAKVVEVKVNQGYGYGIVQGLEAAQGEILSWTHADLQTDPIDVKNGFAIFQKELAQRPNVILKGKRINRPFIDQFFTTGMQIVVLAKTHVPVDDINAQPKIFTRNFYQQIKNQMTPPSDFSLDLYLLLMARKMRFEIIDFPVDFKTRLFGEAKGGGSLKTKFKLTKRTLKYIMEFKLS